jgi:hypothetical protein
MRVKHNLSGTRESSKRFSKVPADMAGPDTDVIVPRILLFSLMCSEIIRIITTGSWRGGSNNDAR